MNLPRSDGASKMSEKSETLELAQIAVACSWLDEILGINQEILEINNGSNTREDRILTKSDVGSREPHQRSENDHSAITIYRDKAS